MINPLDARIVYLSGHLDKSTLKHYLSEKTEQERDKYEAEQIRIENHLETCEDCANRLERFVNTFNPGEIVWEAFDWEDFIWEDLTWEGF